MQVQSIFGPDNIGTSGRVNLASAACYMQLIKVLGCVLVYAASLISALLPFTGLCCNKDVQHECGCIS